MTAEKSPGNHFRANTNSVTCKLRSVATAALLTTVFTTTVQADDIDVYTAQIAATQKPNILFVLDYSGSMARNIYGGRASPTNPAKIDILKDAMEQVLDNNMDRINAGVGSLYSATTTGIRWPISELNDDAHNIDADIPTGEFTVRDIIKKQIDERDANGSTATVDALVEAAQYFRGEAVTHNDQSLRPANRHKPHRWNTSTQRYDGGRDNAAIAASYSPANAYAKNSRSTFYCDDYSASGGPNYCASKLISNCTLRDANDSPTAGFERLENLWGNYQRCEYSRSLDWVGARYNSPIAQTCQANAIVLISDGQPTTISDGDSLKSVVGTGLRGCEDLSTRIFNQPPGTKVDGNCGPEVLRSLSSRDQNPSIPGSHVTTYTVGFNIDGEGQNYLTLLADAGRGTFFKADKPEELNNALSTIVDEVLGGSENFVSLSIDVDKANFSHDNRAFYSLFTPSVRRAWSGNLKGYFVERTGLIDINGLPATEISDNGVQFTDEAQSFWSTTNDGNKVSEGGASEKLVSGTRNLLTYTGTSIRASGEALTGSANHQLQKSNSAITHSMMGLADGSALRDTSLDWIQNAPMGDPLHSKSVTINYGTRQVVYVMTNQGLLHAIDATTPTDPTSADSSGGDELFAFMPKRLLKNLPALAANANTGSHIYGLDGALTRWHSDDNNDGIVNGGESVLLIMGMRRGGNAYFALDVSVPTAPRLQWIIDNTNPMFPELAQSWSRMSLITVSDRGAQRRVLAFGAGYDAGIQDSANGPVASLGNAIYMVDKSGTLVWSINNQSHPSMAYSIASDLTIIDTNGDNLADRLYVGDVAGQIWRVDFDDISRNPTVTLFADLDDGHQPFFYPPSVAKNRDAKGDFLSVSIGSGNRTNPLLTGTQNYLYMLRDTDLINGSSGTFPGTIDSSDLFDATNNTVGSNDAAVAQVAKAELENARGWKVALQPNEKALSTVVTFEGKVMATTFEAQTPTDATVCGFETVGRYYQMEVDTAKPVSAALNSPAGADATASSRITRLQSSGIPSSPVVIFPKGSGAVQVVVDKETVNLINQPLKRVYWHAK